MTTKENNSNLTPKIYSYIRFSTPEQSLGDSEKRQLEQAIAYANNSPLELDKTVMFDRGLSGYHAEHKRKGALGKFLAKVEQGEIARGSILLIENVDRLSREPLLTALGTFTDLLSNGISIQTLHPKAFYDKKALNDTWAIFELIGQMKSAHASSADKGDRVKSARKNKRDAVRNGTTKVFTKRVPVWLQVKTDKNKNEYLKAIPEAALTIKEIFDSYLAGDSLYAIEKKLNQSATWMPPPTTKKKKGGNGWRRSYIAKILKNPAVMGWFQPWEIVKEVDEEDNETQVRKPAGKVIKDYYDTVVDENTFYAVQKKLEQKTYIEPTSGRRLTKTGGQTGQFHNLLRHLVTCAYCGGSMRFENKGKGTKGGKKFVCDNARRSVGCETHYIDYDEVEQLILSGCRRVKPEQVLPNPDEQAKLCQQLNKCINGRIANIAELEEDKSTIRKNIRLLKSAQLVKDCENDILELEQQIADETKQLKADEAALHNAQNDRESFAKRQRDIKTLLNKIEGNPDLRMQLNSHLKEFIERITIYPIGFKELYDFDKDDKKRSGRSRKKDGSRAVIRTPQYINNTDTIEDYIYDVFGDEDPKLLRTKKFRKFVDEMIKRSMSKEGRFVRMHFTGGAWIDLVPEGSMASGQNIKGLWVQPKVVNMWKEFNRVNGQKC